MGRALALVVLIAGAAYASDKRTLQFFGDTTLPEEIMNEIMMNVSTIVPHRGYACEQHSVTTEDGYILTLHRVLTRNRTASNRSPVFLQHGLLDSSFTWVSNAAHQSLAFILADHGFDVWMGNTRGNKYSRMHKTYDPDEDDEYWSWSFDELAKFDVPACIAYVLQVTNKDKLTWIGHSQGAMIAFAGFSNRTVAEKVNLLIGLAPVTRVSNTLADLRHLAPLATTLHAAMYFFGLNGEVMPSSSSMIAIGEPLCLSLSSLCSQMVTLIASQIAHKLNQTRIPIYFSHAPAGTSAQNIVHFAQSVVQKRFQRFDRGPFQNLKSYGQIRPPEYNLTSVTIPVAVFWSEQDKIATSVDVEWTIERIPNLVLNRKLQNYGHLDFLWASDAHRLVYRDILRLLGEFNS